MVIINDFAEKISAFPAKFKWKKLKGNYNSKFRFLIKNLSKKKNKPADLLINEYDVFIIRFITDDELREENRSQLKDFFSVLKGTRISRECIIETL